ncbi:hypothetical protein HUB98_05370 [Paenibacillus barcinonensis]|uniref:Uncharacterized protein n=1 Tax=Paenibacillus barcinonensis TaxID=198119 RepID=A0A2V4VVE0_PAEBA|nr:hypothetical protein [Paenibacillus barcinonensis]PYE51417.1 hypothetical protein DFQ00_102211 [Paenibacillus barcinonensis]QKS55813.1 hypothetical protein HUB98_05370 [Paenibacillus barcinonensis]
MKKMFRRLFGTRETAAMEEVQQQFIEQEYDFSQSYVPYKNTTIVYLPAIDFHSERFAKRPQRLLKALAEIGYNIIYINSNDEYYQVDDLEYPYSLLPHFVVARAGQNVRALFGQNRIVYWVNDSRLTSSVEAAYPDLVVYDSLTDPDQYEKQKHAMEAIADVVFITPERIYEHGRYCSHIHLITAEEYELRERAEQIAGIIDQLPNRPVPLM